MNFLKQMKTRERVEMSLKTIMALIAGLILIILMEGMIYSIYLNKIEENKATQYINKQCTAYCELVDENEYKVYLNDTVHGSWQVLTFNHSKEQIQEANYGKVVYRKPNPFDVSITPTHYIVMAVFECAILGFYGWRFYRLDKEYKAFEKKYKKTGKIFA